jgi:hypothetical protein
MKIKMNNWTHCLEIQEEGDPFQDVAGRVGHLGDPLDLAEVAEGQNPEGEGREDVLIEYLL